MSEPVEPTYEGNVISAQGRFGRGGSDGPVGGDGDGGMEARIAKLESDMAHVLRDTTTLSTEMKDVRERLARVEVKIDHLPTKEYFNRALIGALVLIAALVAFADRIQAFVGGQ